MPSDLEKTLKQAIGITDGDLARLGPRVRRNLSAAPQLRQLRIVAQGTDAKYCFQALKVGQKLVFTCAPFQLSPRESDCPLCLSALKPVLDAAMLMREPLLAGQAPEQVFERTAECLDPGLDYGGLGHVRFKVFLEKA